MADPRWQTLSLKEVRGEFHAWEATFQPWSAGTHHNPMVLCLQIPLCCEEQMRHYCKQATTTHSWDHMNLDSGSNELQEVVPHAPAAPQVERRILRTLVIPSWLLTLCSIILLKQIQGSHMAQLHGVASHHAQIAVMNCARQGERPPKHLARWLLRMKPCDW